MTKTYFNDAVVGNCSMLGCITEKGELVRLYWPHIDYPQHLEKISVGIFLKGSSGTTWLDCDEWRREQRYIENTNILETLYQNDSLKIRLMQTDFVLPDEDVLIRRYEILNMGDAVMEPLFMHYSSMVTTNHHLACVIFDDTLDALIHYKYNYYISVSADLDVVKYQLGNDAYSCAGRAQLGGYDNIGMMNDGALAFRLGEILPNDRKYFNLYICAAHTIKEVKKIANKRDCSSEFGRTEKYWHDFLKSTKCLNTGNAVVDELYSRSILVFKLMSDKKTGGLLASPEIDEEFTKCGRYAYCWGRDAAFITGALDICGLHDDVDKFYRWAAGIQDEAGSWQQRYHLDGNLAPSWGLQIDETGTVLWGILQHFKTTGDMKFLKDMKECVRKGADFLMRFVDADTGLPWLSFDLWEERLGEHAYSTAAVYGGIMAAAEIGRILEYPDCEINKLGVFAKGIKTALEKNFWKKDWHRFIRSVRVKLNPWGEEHSQNRVNMKVNSKGDIRDFTAEDWNVDISLLGLTVPFGVYEAGHPMMEGTLEVVEQVLGNAASGGLMRYENDGYAGGNPWLIAALWAALYHIEKNDYEKAFEYFYWAVDCRTSLGLLPEQAHRETGKPAWVIPLTWSHAMFVLVLDKLLEKGNGKL